MPGKVNPVIPEHVAQCALRAIANDAAIALAAASGQLELNAFLPLIADALLESLALLRDATTILRERCIETLEADAAACARHLDASTAPALLLVPELGYDAAAALAKEALSTGRSIRSLVVEQKLLPPERIDRLFPERRP